MLCKLAVSFIRHSSVIKSSLTRMASTTKLTLAPTVKLNNGYEMPVLGLGTYELKKLKCENAVRCALELGYRHIDTAYLYRNEGIIGQVLSNMFACGQIARSDIFLTTKLWDIFHEPHRVRSACELQLKQLSVDYIDLYLMHSPVGVKYVSDEDLMPHTDGLLETNDVDYLETYTAMEELIDLGMVRSIGVSNFNIEQLQRLLDNCRHKPVTNQVECHLQLNQLELIEFCRQHNIVVTAYSPLGRPKLSKPLPGYYVDPMILSIAAKYGKSPQQVVLRYLLELGTIVIPKAGQLQHLHENFNLFDFKLTAEESKDNDCEIAVKHAIDIGYRHIDTAYFYKNEAEVGKAIREKICDGAVKRADIFLVTKLWNIHHEPSRVEGACRRQLDNFGLDYIDLYLMHLPVGYKFVNEETLLPKNEKDELQLTDVDYLDTYKAMEKLVKLGLVRSIGVSNFNSEQLKRVLDNCEIKPVTNQVECSPALNQKELTAFCKKHDVTVTAYSPLGRPKPSEQKPDFIYSPKVQAIAEKYCKTGPQIVLRYLVELGVIPIPKSSNATRITENFDIFDFELTSEEREVLDCFHTGERLVPFNLIKGQNHKYFPFSIKF